MSFLQQKANEFCNELNLLFTAVFNNAPFIVDQEFTDERCVVRTSAPDKFLLSAGKKISILVEFSLTLDKTEKILSTTESKFHLFYAKAHEPLFRYEFVRDSSSLIPNAHLQIHAERGEIILLQNDGLKDKIHKVANIHFPVGGSLMRPSLEEVLLMADREFHLNFSKDKVQQLLVGIKHFRELQFKSLVQRHEDVLTSMGWVKN